MMGECHDCGQMWVPGQAGGIEDGCPTCGGVNVVHRPDRSQPTPIHDEMEMRNMPAPGEDDTGGNPLEAPGNAISAGEGWQNAMKRDESFASVRAAINPVVAPMSDSEQFFIHGPEGQGNDYEECPECHALTRMSLGGCPHCGVQLDKRPVPGDPTRLAFMDNEGYYEQQEPMDNMDPESHGIPQRHHDDPNHPYYDPPCPKCGRREGAFEQGHCAACGFQETPSLHTADWTPDDNMTPYDHIYTDQIIEPGQHTVEVDLGGSTPVIIQGEKGPIDNAKTILESGVKVAAPAAIPAAEVAIEAAPEIAAGAEEAASGLGSIASKGWNAVKGLFGAGSKATRVVNTVGHLMNGANSQGASNPVPDPLLSHFVLAFDHPSVDQGLNERSDGDPNDVDANEFKDGEDMGLNDLDNDAGGSDVPWSDDLGDRFMSLLPLILHYFNSPEQSGLDDPMISALHQDLEKQAPGYSSAEPDPEAGSIINQLQQIVDQHQQDDGGENEGHPQLPNKVGGPAFQPQIEAPQNAVQPQGQHPGSRMSCPFCGGVLEPGQATCPQCHAAVATGLGGIMPQKMAGPAPTDPNAMPADPSAGGMAPPGMMAPPPPPPPPGSEGTQGPHNREQFQAVAELLQQEGRQDEIPTMLAHPENYADELAQIQKTQAPPQPDPSDPQPAQEEAPPEATMPMPGMNVQGGIRDIDPGHTNPEAYDGKSLTPGIKRYMGYPEIPCPTCQGKDLDCPQCYGEGNVPVGQDGAFQLPGLEEDSSKFEPGAWGVEPLPWGDSVQPRQGRWNNFMHTGADNLADPCPKCGSHTTGLINDDGDCGCHTCGHKYKLKEKVVTAADHEHGHDHPNFEGAPAADQQGQYDPEMDQDSSHTWVDSSGQPLIPGQQYEMFTAQYDIPDIIQVDQVKPDGLVYTLQGEYGLSHRTEVTREESQLEGLSFQPVGQQGAADALAQQQSDPQQAEQPQPDTHEFGLTAAIGAEWLNDGSFKTAGRAYTPMEQREFIDERGTARNISKLDLSNTHYDQADLSSMDDQFLW